MLQDLIGYLDMPDTDFWYDDGCEMARKIIDQNSDVIMKQIIQELSAWPVERQEHLAYILGDSDSDAELELIRELLKSDNPDVAFRANEALVEINQKA